MPRFDQSFNGLCEQNLQETQQLKQRYLDGKNKRVPKTKDKKQQDSIQSSVHVQQKFLKRSVEEHDPGGGGAGGGDGYEPPVKLQCTTQHGNHPPEGLTKFSVEIVQQLEFTTSAANSQPQQISTNVTVKTHANASVKSDVASPKPSNPATPAKNNSNIVSGVDGLVECVKQEPDNDFADLDQCAAALEKDAVAHGGAGFGAFTDLIGDDTNDDTLKDLISDITNCPEFMTEFDFGDKSDVVNALKVEDLKDISSSLTDATANNIHSPLMQNQNYSPPVFENKNRLSSYSNMDFGKTELSPAAQTLKQMAEQHQHKNQMGLSYNPNGRAPNARSPYPDFQLPDYGSPNSNNQFHKGNSTFPQADMIKQEIMFQGSDFDMKRKGASAGIYKQQYSPYGSPSANSHGSPGYLPRGNATNNTAPNANNFGAGTPPRPPSGPGGNNSTTTLQINQAQQLHISQQNHGHNIQVSAGQHLHLSGELKGNVSVATQQGMHFSHVSSNTNTSQPQPPQQPQSQPPQNTHATSQNTAPQQSQTNQHASNQNAQQQQQQPQPQQNGPQQHSNSMLSGNQHPNLQNSLGGMTGSSIPSNMSSNISPGIGNSMHSPGLGGMTNSNSMAGNGLGGGGGLPSGLAGNNGLGGGNTMMGPGGIGGHGVMPGNHLSGQTSLGDNYSLSQSQTINFTQQTLRQRANGSNGMTTTMGPGGPQFGPGGPMNANAMAPRHLNPQALEHQKLIQQQQMLRAQQAAVQQQQQQQQHVRPPPPEYKASAGMMQGMQPSYRGVPPNVRRCLQPMPPSGPMMMRPHSMYMVQQQQHMSTRGMYPRQQTMNSMDGIPPQGGSNEWRHMLMSQQQTANFPQQMRPSFQQGFNMNSGNMTMSALQHQQLRVQQQGIVGNSIGQGMGQGMNQGQVMGQGSPMSQMNTINQQMMSHIQQQQSVLQQTPNQMSMSSIHMQQTQSVSLTSQAMQQQQNMNNQLVNPANTGNNQSNAMNAFNSQTNDFSLEFLDNLPSTDTGGFSEQELLSSFDNDSGFNFQDIL